MSAPAAAVILRRAADAVKIEQRALFAESEDLLARATKLGELERKLRAMAVEAASVEQDEREAQKHWGPDVTALLTHSEGVRRPEGRSRASEGMR